MIRDVVIIKDGVPLFSKSFPDQLKVRTSIFAEQDNLIMVSGFFSALDSFSDQFDDLGFLSEIKFNSQKNNLRISLRRDNKIPNLLYLASFDEESNSVNVHKYLRKISNNFSNQYNIEQIKKWSGRINAFKAFEDVVGKYVDKEKNDFNSEFINKLNRLLKVVEDKFSENSNYYQDTILPILKQISIKKQKTICFHNFIPVFKSTNNINPRHYLTGELSHKVFYQINGEKSIIKIANDLNVTADVVHNICKVLIKFGFIYFAEN